MRGPRPDTGREPGGVGEGTGTGADMTGATGTGESFGDLASGAGVGSSAPLSSSVYVDSAIPRTQVRFRFDSEYDINRPDRGEFYYPKCGCFGTPDAKGPPLMERRIDSDQEYTTYFEYAFAPTFSTFIEAPIRAINPQVNANASGFGDLNAGFKYAFVYSADRVMTTQLRAYTPTGDGRKGLGVRHVSLEPSFLYYQRLGDRLYLESELRDWIPIGGSDFESNVIRYGTALSFLAYRSDRFTVRPVAELVGWTFLGGKELDPDSGMAVSASGNTIVNAKGGVRFGFGDLSQPGFLNQSDLAISYGRALTGTFLYKDIVRLEFRMRF
jgi:hypothetical protein